MSPSQVDSLMNMAKGDKEIYVHHHHHHLNDGFPIYNEQPKPKTKTKKKKKKKNKKKKEKVKENIPIYWFDHQYEINSALSTKPTTYHMDPYDSFYNIDNEFQSDANNVKNPKYTNYEMYQPFDPVWAVAKQKPSLYVLKRTSFKKQTGNKPTKTDKKNPFLLSSNPLLYNSVDDYSNPIFQGATSFPITPFIQNSENENIKMKKSLNTKKLSKSNKMKQTFYTVKNRENIHPIINITEIATIKTKPITTLSSSSRTLLNDLPKIKINNSSTKFQLPYSTLNTTMNSSYGKKSKSFDSFCMERNDGYYPVLEDDCKSYILCIQGSHSQRFNCPKETKFDHGSQVCQWSHNVLCKKI
ncbi:hypothetical protein BLOT_010254 [Blomia tropicalis]|nr:hypothetical protein BLOT_010254 [Blomia tropicalis]